MIASNLIENKLILLERIVFAGLLILLCCSSCSDKMVVNDKNKELEQLQTDANSSSVLKSKLIIQWINCLKGPCTGIASAMRLDLIKDEQLDSVKWNLYGSLIRTTNNEIGDTYKLTIKEIIDSDYTRTYFLIDIQKFQLEEELLIKGAWELLDFEGKSISLFQVSTAPTLIIDIEKLTFSGVDGCNSYGGTLINLEGNQIEFGQMRATMMFCNDTINEKFCKLLKEAREYELEDSLLFLFNESGDEILKFAILE